MIVENIRNKFYWNKDDHWDNLNKLKLDVHGMKDILPSYKI